MLSTMAAFCLVVWWLGMGMVVVALLVGFRRYGRVHLRASTPLSELTPDQRAERLLLSVLTPEQRGDWQRRRRIVVSGRLYDFVLCAGSPWIVVFLKGRGRADSGWIAMLGFYAAAEYGLPKSDQILAQLLHVRSNLSEIERKACGAEGLGRRLQ
jgi:hypothetical protein